MCNKQLQIVENRSQSPKRQTKARTCRTNTNTKVNAHKLNKRHHNPDKKNRKSTQRQQMLKIQIQKQTKIVEIRTQRIQTSR